MKLSAKFSIIFIVVFGLGLTVTGYLSYSLLQKNAREQVNDRAKIMMETALAMRRYTVEQVKPVINKSSATAPVKVFNPENRAAAYAATEMFNYLHEKYPDYSYKEAAVNPNLNLSVTARGGLGKRTSITQFRNNTNLTNFRRRTGNTHGQSLFISHVPLRSAACRSALECHSTPDAALPSDD